MTSQRIDARDVLDPNAKTARAFAARILGHFRPVGPNPWDDYVFEPTTDGENIDVLALVPVQVEPEGARFRMRRHGEVLRLRWEPADTTAKSDDRTRFLATCVRPWAEEAGRGAAAVIAETLNSTPPKPSLD